MTGLLWSLLLLTALAAGLATLRNVNPTPETIELSSASSPMPESLRGETLAERLGRGVLARTEALQVGIEVCQALEELHSRGLVHQGLKPENLVLTLAGVRLLDCVGEPGRVSPLDHRADLYSLGLVLREALSGGPALDVDPELARVVNWLMAGNPADRPQSARQARLALERLLLARVTGSGRHRSPCVIVESL